jgi:NADP-dependent 3-hydroxy acid dehydrogenase YdfG
VKVLPLALDVRDHAQVAALAKQVGAWRGHVDILINNAGGSPGNGPRHLFERDPADIEDLTCCLTNK